MHPMFVQLYLEPDTDQDEQDKRRRAARAPPARHPHGCAGHRPRPGPPATTVTFGHVR